MRLELNAFNLKKTSSIYLRWSHYP